MTGLLFGLFGAAVAIQLRGRSLANCARTRSCFLRSICGTKNFHSGRAHPLRRYARQRVSRAPVPFVGAALGCWGGRPHRPMVRRWGARGLVAFGSAEPRIAKSDEKLARVFVGSLCGACGVLLRLLPAVSDLFSHPTSHHSSPEWAHLRYLPTRRAGLRFHRGALTLAGRIP